MRHRILLGTRLARRVALLIVRKSALSAILFFPSTPCAFAVTCLQVARRILMGTYALSAGYYDAYYKRAQQVQQGSRHSRSGSSHNRQGSSHSRTVLGMLL